MLVDVDYNEVLGKPKPSPKVQFCEQTINEFVRRDSGCAEVTEYQEYGPCSAIVTCLRTCAKKRASERISVKTRKGHIYLVKPTPRSIK